MMKKTVIYLVFCVLISLIFAFVNKSENKEYQEKQWIPAKGFVPDELTARKIAEAVLLPIYGKEIISQKPFKVELIGDVWVITGVRKELALAGVVHIEIQRSDCKILKVFHGK